MSTFCSTYGWRLLVGLRVTVEVVAISCALGFVLSYPGRARACRATALLAWPRSPT